MSLFRPEALARLQAAVSRAPSNPQAPRPAAPQPQAEPVAERPRFGINSLINRMTGGQSAAAQPQARAMPTMRPQTRAAEFEEENQAEPEQDRIEIPAFLRRQAN